MLRLGQHGHIHFDTVSEEISDVIGVEVLVDGPGRVLAATQSSAIKFWARETLVGGSFYDLSLGLDMSLHSEGDVVQLDLYAEALVISGLARGHVKLSLSGPPVPLEWDQ